MRIIKINVLGFLTNSAIIFAMATILLGSYTRLTDAGLGCPDWPACYGFIIVPKTAQLAQAQEKFPNSKFEPNKAHNEMSHRYIAGLLGLSVLFIFIVSQWKKRSRVLTGFILLLVMMQAALGMWTVTLQLMPLVVLAHLLGGFSLLSLLVLLRLQIKENVTIEPEPQLASLLPFGFLMLFVLTMQISLGAWTSSNYAALACHELPLCESGWEQHFNFSSAFSLPIGQPTYQYGVMPYEARLSIHVLHRVGAMVTFILLGSFSYLAWNRARTKIMKRFAIGIATLLILQCCLGLINVIAYLPLISAVAHNFVAANLLMLLVVFIYQLYQRRVYLHLRYLQQQNLQPIHQQTNSNTAKV
jgi:cytochrome c oxidase assembly protein subunit 15